MTGGGCGFFVTILTISLISVYCQTPTDNGGSRLQNARGTAGPIADGHRGEYRNVYERRSNVRPAPDSLTYPEESSAGQTGKDGTGIVIDSITGGSLPDSSFNVDKNIVVTINEDVVDAKFNEQHGQASPSATYGVGNTDRGTNHGWSNEGHRDSPFVKGVRTGEDGTGIVIDSITGGSFPGGSFNVDKKIVVNTNEDVVGAKFDDQHGQANHSATSGVGDTNRGTNHESSHNGAVGVGGKGGPVIGLGPFGPPAGDRDFPFIQGLRKGEDGTGIVIDSIVGGSYPDGSFSIGHGADIHNGYGRPQPKGQHGQANPPATIGVHDTDQVTNDGWLDDGKNVVRAQAGEIVIGSMSGSNTFGPGSFTVGEPGRNGSGGVGGQGGADIGPRPTRPDPHADQDHYQPPEGSQNFNRPTPQTFSEKDGGQVSQGHNSESRNLPTSDGQRRTGQGFSGVQKHDTNNKSPPNFQGEGYGGHGCQLFQGQSSDSRNLQTSNGQRITTQGSSAVKRRNCTRTDILTYPGQGYDGRGFQLSQGQKSGTRNLPSSYGHDQESSTVIGRNYTGKDVLTYPGQGHEGRGYQVSRGQNSGLSNFSTSYGQRRTDQGFSGVQELDTLRRNPSNFQSQGYGGPGFQVYQGQNSGSSNVQNSYGQRRTDQGFSGVQEHDTIKKSPPNFQGQGYGSPGTQVSQGQNSGSRNLLISNGQRRTNHGSAGVQEQDAIKRSPPNFQGQSYGSPGSQVSQGQNSGSRNLLISNGQRRTNQGFAGVQEQDAIKKSPPNFQGQSYGSLGSQVSQGQNSGSRNLLMSNGQRRTNQGFADVQEQDTIKKSPPNFQGQSYGSLGSQVSQGQNSGSRNLLISNGQRRTNQGFAGVQEQDAIKKSPPNFQGQGYGSPGSQVSQGQNSGSRNLLISNGQRRTNQGFAGVQEQDTIKKSPPNFQGQSYGSPGTQVSQGQNSGSRNLLISNGQRRTDQESSAVVGQDSNVRVSLNGQAQGHGGHGSRISQAQNSGWRNLQNSNNKGYRRRGTQVPFLQGQNYNIASPYNSKGLTQYAVQGLPVFPEQVIIRDPLIPTQQWVGGAMMALPGQIYPQNGQIVVLGY